MLLPGCYGRLICKEKLLADSRTLHSFSFFPPTISSSPANLFTSFPNPSHRKHTPNAHRSLHGSRSHCFRPCFGRVRTRKGESAFLSSQPRLTSSHALFALHVSGSRRASPEALRLQRWPLSRRYALRRGGRHGVRLPDRSVSAQRTSTTLKWSLTSDYFEQ